jgi:hypothetical protein
MSIFLSNRTNILKNKDDLCVMFDLKWNASILEKFLNQNLYYWALMAEIK